MFNRGFFLKAVLLLLGSACSSQSNDSGGTGGTQGSGGKVGSGGTTTSGSRGVISSGGSTTSSGGKTTASGGMTASGGTTTSSGGTTTASGGMTASGGTTTSSGGTTTASGGMTASGGTTTSSGGTITASGGKTTASGGSTTASGGTASGGSTTGLGGTKASGGSTGADGGPISTGGNGGAASCGTKTTSDCGKSGTKCTLKVNDTDRTFYVELPSNYKPTTPYRLIFQFHPLGQTAESALTMYGLKSRISDAIFVTPQGLGSGGSTGWPNNEGEDVAFTKAMVDYLETNFCVDRSKIFSTGFSYGGIMSITVACQMSDVFRAIAPESGQLFGGSCSPKRPVAVWQSNGNADGMVTPSAAQTANNYFVKANGCSSTTHAVSPSPCVMYDGCKAGYDVTWCLFSGSHEMPSFGPDAIAAFFKQF